MDKLQGVRCPLCGGNVLIGAKGYFCENHFDDEKKCDFNIWKNFRFQHDFTDAEAKALIRGEKVGPLHLKSKAGKPYAVLVFYNKDENKLDTEFPHDKKRPSHRKPAPAIAEEDEDEDYDVEETYDYA